MKVVDEENILISLDLSLDATVREREETFPVLRMCSDCVHVCKMHGARSLLFKCFNFRRRTE